jgi:arabinan endo-1,5-alpha-L-arabinosidase
MMFFLRKSAVRRVACVILALVVLVSNFSVIVEVESNIVRRRIAVHDPAIIKVGNEFFLFGSHLESARSSSLLGNWSMHGARPADRSPFFGNIFTELAEPASWARQANPNEYRLEGNLWAADVMWNPNLINPRTNRRTGMFAMYLSVNGPEWNSVIILCVSENISGPYTYVGPIVYSGFTNGSVNNVRDTDVPRVLGNNPDISRYLHASGNRAGRWNDRYGTNAIDAQTFFCREGKLWMTYGSWFGGIFLLELDPMTGLRDYNRTYPLTTNASDPYMGIRIAGGHAVTGEGPYIEYIDGYYYLWVTYGHFVNHGGYNMRVFRSRNVNGPYVDMEGRPAIRTSWSNLIAGNVGFRQLSNYQWSVNPRPFQAQGHNSVLTDNGKYYNIFHTKFDDDRGFHEVRVHQMVMNRDGWPVLLPYEYSGETLRSGGHQMAAVAGEYDFIFHRTDQPFIDTHAPQPGQAAAIERPVRITLNANGTISGALTGTWTMEADSPHMTLTFGGHTYKGAFVVMPDESPQQVMRMTFAAAGNNSTVWGSRNAAYNPEQDVAVTTSVTTTATPPITTTATSPATTVTTTTTTPTTTVTTITTTPRITTTTPTTTVTTTTTSGTSRTTSPTTPLTTSGTPIASPTAPETTTIPVTTEDIPVECCDGQCLYGDVDDNKIVNITDALEILKYLAGLDGNLLENDEKALRHSLIMPVSKETGIPSINDVLEILKYLAGLPNLIVIPYLPY